MTRGNADEANAQDADTSVKKVENFPHAASSTHPRGVRLIPLLMIRFERQQFEARRRWVQL